MGRVSEHKPRRTSIEISNNRPSPAINISNKEQNNNKERKDIGTSSGDEKIVNKIVNKIINGNAFSDSNDSKFDSKQKKIKSNESEDSRPRPPRRKSAEISKSAISVIRTDEMLSE